MAFHTRYGSITTEPDKRKFIDRLAAGNRIVARNHMAALSTPQQAQMVLFSLFSRMDSTQHPSGRVSLANLNEFDYRKIGRAIRKLTDDFVERYQGAGQEPSAKRGQVTIRQGKTGMHPLRNRTYQ